MLPDPDCQLISHPPAVSAVPPCSYAGKAPAQDDEAKRALGPRGGAQVLQIGRVPRVSWGMSTGARQAHLDGFDPTRRSSHLWVSPAAA